MGASPAYVLVLKLLEEGMPLPVELFVSGSAGPIPVTAKKDIWRLPTDEMVEVLIPKGGMRAAGTPDPEFVEHFVPLLRTDLDFEAASAFFRVDESSAHPGTDNLILGRGRPFHSRRRKLMDEDVTKEICTTSHARRSLFLFGMRAKHLNHYQRRALAIYWLKPSRS